MTRHIFLLLLLLFCSFFFAGCGEQAGVSGLGHSRTGVISLAPRFTLLGNQAALVPINRLRLTARRVTDNTIVADTTFDVADSPDWTISLSVAPDAGSVVVEIQLLNVTNGTESVEWSGRSDPITVKAGETSAPAQIVNLVQGPPDNLGITSVSVLPKFVTVEEGGTIQLISAIHGGGPSPKCFWTSLDPAVATVDEKGWVETRRNGSARVVAYAGTRADTTLISATQRVASVALTPDTLHLHALGGEGVFNARVLDPRGTEIAGSGVSFTISNTAIAEQVAPGRFRAKANGTANIVAASTAAPAIMRNGMLIVTQRPGRIEISPSSASVNAVGLTRQFAATVRDANGNAMSAPIIWRSANETIASVDPFGLATARSQGETDILALANVGAPDSVVARASFEVEQEANEIEISPEEAQLNALGDTVRFRAVVHDGQNNPIPNVAITWNSSNLAVGTIDATGKFTALAPGAVVVGATAGTLRAHASVSVMQAPVKVVVRRAADTVDVGSTRQFHASVLDAGGNSIDDVEVKWRSSDTTRARVDDDGLVTARAAGTVTISATYNGLSGSASLVIRQPAIVAVVWVGETSSWSDANNWSPRTVPGSTSDVVIPDSLARYPVLSTNASARNLTMRGRATIDLGNSNLTLSGTYILARSIVGNGTVITSGTNPMLEGTFPSLTVQNGAWSNYLDVVRNLTVSGGAFDVRDTNVLVRGSFTTSGTGALRMLDDDGVLEVAGNISFKGGSEIGNLTAGEIRLTGDNAVFTTGTDAGAFLSEGTLVSLRGGDKTVAIGHPAHRFREFEVHVDGTLSLPAGLATDSFFEDPLHAALLSGSGRLKVGEGNLTLSGVTISGLTLDIDHSAVNADGVTFLGYSTLPDVDQLIVRADGLAEVVMKHVTFDVAQLPSAGHYWVSLPGGGQLMLMYPSPATRPDPARVFDPSGHIVWPYTPW